MLKEPLLHFLILGGLIFVLYSAMQDGPGENEIIITEGQQENLINTFSRTWQRPPTSQEFKGLLDEYLREEIAYREGRELGFDQDDIVIRRRLRQKLELLAEDVASLNAPSDEQLQQFLDENVDDYLIEPRLTLRQIYFSRDRRGDQAEQDAEALLQVLLGAGPAEVAEGQGDPLPLPDRIEGLRTSELARMFGRVFSEGLQGKPENKWFGPVESGFGLHLVFIERRTEGANPELEQVRAAVQRDWFSQQRRNAVDRLYERLLEDYRVSIEPLTDTPATTGAP